MIKILVIHGPNLDLLGSREPEFYGKVTLKQINSALSNLAKKLGLKIIIIDHHEVLDNLPAAEIIVDPKQKGDSYPFKRLATAGITYKLSQIILQKKFSASLKNSFLELTALATIADMMPEIEENKIFIEEGLKSLKNTWRPGLKVFFDMDSVKDYNLIRQIASKIIAALNATETKNHSNEAFLVLTSDSIGKAKNLAQGLLEKSYQKQIVIKEIVEEVREKILSKEENPLIFEGDSSWPLTLIGSVASRICHQFQKPTFIFKKLAKESQGAVRTPTEINSVNLMKKCSQYLLTYGGHPQASGFRIKNDNLEKFKECLIKNL